MLRLFSPSPKSRTTAALLAVLLGWVGLHKFYLGRRNVGFTHIALTAVGPVVFLAQLTAGDAGSVIAVQVAAWAAIVFGYFYARRFHLGHTVAEIANSARLLLWPWLLIRHTLRMTGAGARMVGEEREERRWRRWNRNRNRRGWRRRRRWDDDDDDDGGGCSIGIVVLVLGVILSLAVAAAIVFLYYLVFSFVGYLALAASVAIGVTEGVMYLRRTDAQFEQEYVAGRRPWF